MQFRNFANWPCPNCEHVNHRSQTKCEVCDFDIPTAVEHIGSDLIEHITGKEYIFHLVLKKPEILTLLEQLGVRKATSLKDSPKKDAYLYSSRKKIVIFTIAFCLTLLAFGLTIPGMDKHAQQADYYKRQYDLVQANFLKSEQSIIDLRTSIKEQQTELENIKNYNEKEAKKNIDFVKPYQSALRNLEQDKQKEVSWVTQFEELNKRYSEVKKENKTKGLEILQKSTEIMALTKEIQNMEAAHNLVYIKFKERVKKLQGNITSHENQIRSLLAKNDKLIDSIRTIDKEKEKFEPLSKEVSNVELARQTTATINVNGCRNRKNLPSNRYKCVKSITLSFENIVTNNKRVTVQITGPESLQMPNIHNVDNDNTLNLELEVQTGVLKRGKYKVTLLSSKNEVLITESFKV